ncbi:MAG: site-specific DNA-methyltransferase [Candidatus Lokiarchaeota archaeon]|nr:site-specific DNA-methyltransferase [Candidatus Lokiarchaeota archaeon]
MKQLSTKHLLYFKNSKLMDEIEDESIDLVVTSPPYPMIEMWDDLFCMLNPKIKINLEKNDGKSAHDLMLNELNKTWIEIARVLKTGGIVCINIGDATRKIGKNFQIFSNHSKIINQFESLNFIILPEILWRKQSTKPNKFMGSGTLPTSAYVTQEHEFILIFRKGEPRNFKSKDENRYNSAYFWEERNIWFSDIWMDLKGINQKLNHNDLRERSAAFPFELAYRLINMYSIQGDTVLDPFLGTGTTSFAAIASCRNSFGYETDSNFQALIDERIENINTFSNDCTKERIKNHLDFIKKRELMEKEIKYISNEYGFKVMTKQEVEIILYQIKHIKKLEDLNGFEVSYSKFEF